MKAYIITIITISIVSGIISSLLSSESKLRKHINFISGLVCAIALLSPIVNIAKSTTVLTDSIENIIGSFDISESINNSNQIIIDEGTEQICKGIKEAVKSRFKFNDESIKIEATINDNNIEAIILERITITLLGDATWTDEKQVKEYIEDLVGCNVIIRKE